MDRPEISRTAFVFDLDDTLYPEVDYVRSGRTHVCERLSDTLGIDLHDAVQAAVEAGEKNWLGFLVREAGLPASALETLLWIYRLHPPKIKLGPGWAALLERLERAGRPVVILTDGRSITQRLKVKALGLSHLPVLISEDWGSDKQDPARFRSVMARYPDDFWLYVGDNPAKDFLVPRTLGWHTVGMRTGHQGVHSQRRVDLGPNYQPEVWLDDAVALGRWLGL